jgi:hypothetical protein
MAFYRLLNNEALTMDRLVARLTRWTEAFQPAPGSPPPHVLLIQDTTDVQFDAHRGRIQPSNKLGRLSQHTSHGFCLHATLAVDAAREHVLGLADVQVWARPEEEARPETLSYRDLPIEEKESYRWIEAMQKAHRRLGAAQQPGAETRLTVIADREADIYSLFARRTPHTDVLVRAKSDRRLVQHGQLFAHLAAQPLLGQRLVWLRGDARKKTPGRWATLSYRAAPVEVTRPNRSAKPDARGVPDARTLHLWGVEIAETPSAPLPAGAVTVHWRLLTTHPAETFEQAAELGAWYQQRWHIEQVFRALKQDGIGIERSELETGAGLWRLSVLALGAALEVSRLLLSERGESSGDLGEVFSASEQALLCVLCAQMSGRTAKQRNPHEAGTLAWGAWVIARLGGWKGYASQHRAGPATYHRGLRRFHDLHAGWAAAQTCV